MKLKEYIQLRDITVIIAAKELGVTRQYVYALMTGQFTAGRKMAMKIRDWSQNLVKFDDLWE